MFDVPTCSADISATYRAINRHYLIDDNELLAHILSQLNVDERTKIKIEALARDLVIQVRQAKAKTAGVEAFLHEYDLSTQEGIMLMCLAEALLRIPDAETADRLIKDKLSQATWVRHLGKSPSLFVNASTWGLMLTGGLVKLSPEVTDNPPSFFSRLVSRSGEPVIRMAVRQAMRLIGQQFVMGATIEDALDRRRKDASAQTRYSYDMLGEAALTRDDARRYFEAYSAAIATIAQHIEPGDTLFDNPGISVKLSALHPRYEFSRWRQVKEELTPRLLELARQAHNANIHLTVDAEEADRLELSLDIFQTVLRDPALDGGQGFGLAVQAYQKRALAVVEWLVETAHETGRRIPVRLVKGAYWDTEIKRAQERGLADYPVFTRKSATDVSYLACAQRLLAAQDVIYPQFATHNAHTVAAISVLAGTHGTYEFQRLHGMGEMLYGVALDAKLSNAKCRIYAPVGDHKELLPYLVRRLLENGANTSFVHRILDDDTPAEEIIADPIRELRIHSDKRHPRIPVPQDIYGEQRRNAGGINLTDRDALHHLESGISDALSQSWLAAPIVNGQAHQDGPAHPVLNPADHDQIIGQVVVATPQAIEDALTHAQAAAPGWNTTAASERAAALIKTADLLETHQAELIGLIVKEGGRTLPDALSEVREAVDFCRYYGQQAMEKFADPIVLPGVTGERNLVYLNGRGVFACISPWNFPVAIFTGQIAAALAAGNAVIAKPALLTPLCAALVVRLMHEAGVPPDVLHLLPGSGADVGRQLIGDERIAGVAITGACDTAHRINQLLAQRPKIAPLIAETGGQNAMIMDSSALPEQAIVDIIASAFNSAGQRCSALRVLFVQQDVAPRITALLQGAMEELNIGDPARLTTDVGPVITADAAEKLNQHARHMNGSGRLIYQCPLPEACQRGSFFPPMAVEIDSLAQLHGEVFGPILHVIPYAANHLDHVIDAINATGFGLTLGIHSRIDATVDYISQRVRCGNTYVNRNMIGAVVGSQPFGGEGLSGTGPKAGGPHYLLRFATERTLTTNTAAVGGNATLLSFSDDIHF